MTTSTGRAAIVTGGATGIGYTDLNIRLAEQTAEELSQHGQCMAIETDVSKEADVIDLVRRTREEFSGVDYLVNNAGIHLHS